MIRVARIGSALACAAALGAAGEAAAVSLGQIDSFQDGTTQGWVVALQGVPHPAPPGNVGGGQGGAGDRYLLLTAVGGANAGSRLTVLNLDQWAGDYLAAGITSVRMTVNNLGTSDLSLRLLFEDPEIGPPTNVAASTAPILVPAGSGWVSIEFPVAPASLTALMGSVETVLSNTTALRLYHATALGYPGEPIVALLGVDDIQTVPEPGPSLLFASGLAGLALRRLAASS